MFGLSFLTTLDYKRIILRTVKVDISYKCGAKFVQANCDRRHRFVLVHRSCEEVAMFVHRRVL